jgi:hypothetical protein
MSLTAPQNPPASTLAIAVLVAALLCLPPKTGGQVPKILDEQN